MKPRLSRGITGAMLVANAILMVLAVYAAIGVLVGAAFVVLGVSKVDHAAIGAGAPWHFRLLIFPGAAALWPIVLRWWFAAERGLQERRP